ncbi:hypothetical protein JCGZ_05553 [Jatropha curcas]|uniref:Uncharacterized protein n=1 Tax=Jatropha curcas TaxID=180498 RepID=A0A067L6J0_JATCU|nr:hypothetical protein JCGZ_05553 [Jatropha curcas]
MEIGEGLLGRLGRQCYAVLCLGAILVFVSIARYYVCDGDQLIGDPKERTTRRLCAIHGPPVRPVTAN